MADNKSQYVQLEPSAFLTDTDYQVMTAEQRGVYCSIIFYLYANGGKLELGSKTGVLVDFDNNVIALLSNCQKTGEEWNRVWSGVEKKFKIKNRVLTHKRVTEELKRAANYREKKSLAGTIGMQHRYNSVSNDDITTKTKDKLSKDVSLAKRKNLPNDLVLGIQKEAVFLHEIIEKKLGPLLPAEQKTFRNLVSFLSNCAKETQSVDVLTQARSLLGDKIDYCERRKKTISEAKRLFVAAIKNEFGYKGEGSGKWK